MFYPRHPSSRFQVHIAGLQTCLFSRTSSVPPTVIIYLLDFEPLVFELQQAHGLGLEEEESIQCEERKEERKRNNDVSSVTAGNSVVYRNRDNNSNKRDNRASQSANCGNIGHGQDSSHSPASSFFSHKGKSCVFTADPMSLSQSLLLPGALTLMVVSKLSERQVSVERKHSLRKTNAIVNNDLHYSIWWGIVSVCFFKFPGRLVYGNYYNRLVFAF